MHKICIYDSRMPSDIIANLEKLGFILVPTVDLEVTKSALDTHPDIQVCKISDKNVVVEPNLYNYYEKNLSKYGIIVKRGSTEVSKKYPYDSSYNAAVGNGKIICNFNYIDKVIKEDCGSLEAINVNQGYTKCNVLFTRSGVITSDMGIFKSVDDPKLIISPGNIKLDGFSYGFIGGASGYYDGSVYFLGDISTHPDYENIKKFLEKEDTRIVSLSDGGLMDYGSLIFLEVENGWNY